MLRTFASKQLMDTTTEHDRGDIWTVHNSEEQIQKVSDFCRAHTEAIYADVYSLDQAIITKTSDTLIMPNLGSR